MKRFPLAPMSGWILWPTVLVLPLPLVLLWLGRHGPARVVLFAAALFIAAIYLFIWLYMRPTAFELTGSSLDVVWPLRRFSVPLADVEGVELLSGPEFRERYGYGLRIGAGGLWGGFGLLRTRTVMFRFYISKLDGYVIVRSRAARPLLITPAEPRRFVAALESLVAR